MSEPLPFTAYSFNKFLSEKKLMASRCQDCGANHLPPRAICPNCHSSRMEWVEAPGTGRLVAYTSIAIAPTFMVQQGFDRNNPYVTGIVELEDGNQISGRILGVDAKHPESIQVGMPVRVAFLESGAGEAVKTSLAFSPVIEPAGQGEQS